MNESCIPITDERGVFDDDIGAEPNPGSVVLTEGEFGTAWQRYFNDGLWHTATATVNSMGRPSSMGGAPHVPDDWKLHGPRRAGWRETVHS